MQYVEWKRDPDSDVKCEYSDLSCFAVKGLFLSLSLSFHGEISFVRKGYHERRRGMPRILLPAAAAAASLLQINYIFLAPQSAL